MTDNRERLKACPFCKGPAEIYVGMSAFTDVLVGCEKCGFYGPTFDNDPIHGMTSADPEADAIAHWNTRASTPTFNDGIEAAAKACDAWQPTLSGVFPIQSPGAVAVELAAAIRSLSLSRPDDGDGGSERNSTCNEGSNANEDSSTKSSGGAE